RQPCARMGGDREVRRPELLGQRRALEVDRQGRLRVAALPLQAGQVVEGGQAVDVVPQRRVQAEGILARLVRRHEVAPAQLQHAEVHRGRRGYVERLRLAGDLQRGAERFRARVVVPRV